MTISQFDLAADAVERWVQELGPQQASQALLGFGLWSPSDGIAPTDNLEAAYDLARRVLGLDSQAIAFRPDGRALRWPCDEDLGRAAALALTRAVLCTGYEAHRL